MDWPNSNDLSQMGAMSPAGAPTNIAPGGGGFSLNPLSWFGGNSNNGGAINAPSTPGLGANTGAAGLGFGANLGTGQLALSGLGTLGNLWTAWNATQLANKSFDFTKNLATTNLDNSVTSYNTNLSDKINARYAQEGQSSQSAQAYINANKLTAGSIG